MSRDNDIADGIVTALNGAGITPSFTAKRKAVTELLRKDFTSSTIVVDVVPAKIETEPLDQANMAELITVATVVGVPVQSESTDDTDAAADLAEAIHDELRNANMAGYTFKNAQRMAPYDMESVRDRNLYVSVIHTTYHAYPP